MHYIWNLKPAASTSAVVATVGCGVAAVSGCSPWWFVVMVATCRGDGGDLEDLPRAGGVTGAPSPNNVSSPVKSWLGLTHKMGGKPCPQDSWTTCKQCCRRLPKSGSSSVTGSSLSSSGSFGGRLPTVVVAAFSGSPSFVAVAGAVAVAVGSFSFSPFTWGLFAFRGLSCVRPLRIPDA